jgi:uncharacterized repeat protein (TIGR04076 family)
MMFPQPKNMEVKIVEIIGYCPTYQVGDVFKIEAGYQLKSPKAVCLHALQGLVPYYVPLSHGIPPYDLGLASKDSNQTSRNAFFQCHDPEHITGGGSVIFRVTVEE